MPQVKGFIDAKGETWVCIEDLLQALFAPGDSVSSTYLRITLMSYLNKLRDKIRMEYEG